MLLTLTSCGTFKQTNLKRIIPEYFETEIAKYSTYNPKYLHSYYYAYLDNNSYIYSLNLINHPSFLQITNKFKTYSDDKLILVNKKFYLHQDSFPKELISISGINYVKRKNEQMLLEQETLINLQNMENFAKQKGITLTVFSAYRSYEKQSRLWLNRHYQDSIYLAYPGHSEHHTGLAVDIGTMDSGLTIHFENTDVFKFLDAYAHTFGFILRYPQDKVHITGYAYEPWHYRYVGKVVATIIKENNLTLEEYLYQYTLLPFYFEP